MWYFWSHHCKWPIIWINSTSFYWFNKWKGYVWFTWLTEWTAMTLPNPDYWDTATIHSTKSSVLMTLKKKKEKNLMLVFVAVFLLIYEFWIFHIIAHLEFIIKANGRSNLNPMVDQPKVCRIENWDLTTSLLSVLLAKFHFWCSNYINYMILSLIFKF